ncbi:5-formyltetrahydrofolate cyclo-ligase [Butyricicoccus sp.]|uniref:5-formyltetrahydrofolate cyclo-ligase n=1 Tax=Butyricicoccus sp. TaxID=2049021 RepID=UPI003F139D61
MALDTMDKASLRRELLRQRKQTTSAEKAATDRAITENVLQSEPYRRSRTLFVYYSTADEIDTHAIIADALQRGKRVCLPKCLPGHIMQPRAITSEGDLTEETFGIPEPGAHCTAVPPDEIDLCLVPALACDKTGARLGYGGGFYDRFLPQTSACRMALCAQARLLEQVPAEPHDIRCGCIITEQEVVQVHEG